MRVTEKDLPNASASRRHSSNTASADESNCARAAASATTAASGWDLIPCVSMRQQAVACWWVISAGNTNMELTRQPLRPALVLLRSASAVIRPSMPLLLISVANWLR